MIPYGKHQITAEDVAAVVDVLENKFITQGELVPAFEEALCEYAQAKYCSVVNSGTSGLHVACLALGIGKGDTVWTSPNSFAASANCALYCGADVDFVDINPATRNMDIELLQDKLLSCANNNCLPKAIVIVHFAGASCDMRRMSALCKDYGVKLIEDAAHGLGGTYDDLPIGSCQYSDIAVLSFHPVKSITTAEGGAVLTNDKDLATKIALFAKHGITREQALMTKPADGPWFYQQLALGYNYRLSDIHAALGLSQLRRVDSFIQARRAIASRYMQLLCDLPVKLPLETDISTSAWHLYMVEVDTAKRKALFEYLQAANIGVNVHYIPIHYHPYYESLGFKKGDFVNAENFYHSAISLPIYVDLSEHKQNYVVDKIREFFENDS